MATGGRKWEEEGEGKRQETKEGREVNAFLTSRRRQVFTQKEGEGEKDATREGPDIVVASPCKRKKEAVLIAASPTSMGILFFSELAA